MRYLFVLLAFLAGCETTEQVWVKSGTTDRDFQSDIGQCRAQAFSVPGAMNNLVQVAMVQNACMQGKGWHIEERPKQ